MAKRIIYEPSRTLLEFRLLPGLTTEYSTIDKISLQTPLVYSADNEKKYKLNIPIVAAAMQSVSGDRMGIELAKLGGVAFIFCSQSVEKQAEMIKKIKSHKAGFVNPKTVDPEMTIAEMYEIREKTGYSTFPVVDDKNVFMGLLSKYDYDLGLHGNETVGERMIVKENCEVGINIDDLEEANNLLLQSHKSVLPILDKEGRLLSLVFRKDINDHLNNPDEVHDDRKRLLAVAAVNTHDYRERIKALAAEEVDVISVDSSDGFSVYLQETVEWSLANYPHIPLIGGNIITAEAFRFLVKIGCSAVKIGMGGGSICITQEQKGTGRGLASSIIDVAQERDLYYQESGRYIPLIADGGVTSTKDITIALALGADYVMMGRYFARMEESPTNKIVINNRVMKPYWGEGSAKAREWVEKRYHQMKFVEGVEGFVEYSGRLRDNLDETLTKIKASMSTCGAADIMEFHQKAELELISALSIREGKAHDVYIPGENKAPDSNNNF
ncbi:MAG: IMP dehydrogenase [Candidatus Cloacimonetes bacterium]|nr:IMP dehydrogenase [Candidatus Cloacimonadota bacterium]